MKKITGSKFSNTWEEEIRESNDANYNRLSKNKYLKNLKLLSKWCEKKINELTLKK